MAFQNVPAADDLFIGVGRERVYAGQVRYGGLGMVLYGAVLAFHGNAGKVSNVLPCAGKLVEESGFSAVLVANQCKGKLFLGNLLASLFLGGLLFVVTAFLSQSRVFNFVHAAFGLRVLFLCRCSAWRGLAQGGDDDFLCVFAAHGQCEPVQTEFYGVAHGGTLFHHHFHAGNHSHVQEVLSQGTVSSHFNYGGPFFLLKFAQCHLDECFCLCTKIQKTGLMAKFIYI